MRKMYLFIFVFLAIGGMYHCFPGIAVADDLFVIGNRSVPVAELSADDIQNIYLGKKKVWENGMKIEIAVLGDGAATDRFLKEYVKKNSSTFNNYWKKQIFTGGGKPPVSFEKEKDMIDYVSKTKGAVGYLTSQSSAESVKILATLH
jgi:ABC-type phosphate transport system substrate-binding protein